MLRECFRVLRPGGRIRISCPDRQFIIDLTGGGELPELASRYVDWARQHFGLPDAGAVGRNLETGLAACGSHVRGRAVPTAPGETPSRRS
jgi:SAM-dependent methyltransferase